MTTDQFIQVLQGSWEILRDFSNSAFASAFLSALAGAALGVWGAQRLAERGVRARELLESLRQANAMVILATTIANQAFSLKKQHISALSIRYFKDREAALEHRAKILNGESPAPILFQAQMAKITPVTVPLDALKNLVYSAQLIPGRSLALVAIIEQSVNDLIHTINIRSELIDNFRSTSVPEHILVQDYYGIAGSNGTNSMYHDSMVAITQYTDDLGFFASELAEEMQVHASAVRKTLLKFRKDVPKAASVDFSLAREYDLIPPRENYESWLSGFEKQDS